MVKIYSAKDFTIMPWKNGRGSTTELLIEPRGARFPQDAFLWRLSSAAITEDGAFSRFESYSRILAVIKGSGLKLNGRSLSLGETYSFEGNEEIFAALSNGPIVDLGLIYDSSKVSAKFLVHINQEPCAQDIEATENETVLFYVVYGKLQLNKLYIREKEVACIDDASHAKVQCESNTLWVEARIKKP